MYSEVLTAIVSLASITLVVACAIPVAFLLCLGRSTLPENRKHNLGRLGHVYNIVGVSYAAMVLVVFFFPSAPNPTPADMNWAIVAFGALTFLAVGGWFLGANKRYSIVLPATGGGR